MKDRLITLMQQLNLSSGQLADKLGVQRSGISHLLSGRNKPSYDFIQKLLYAFPSVNAEWLITGKGSMMKQEQQNELFSFTQEEHNVDLQENENNHTVPGKYAESEHPKEKKWPPGAKQITQVMVFYADGTFSTYIPE